tara:strand:- start:41 stop:238 length:198 start_codon:yes stop_codon:yes gene_type:complete
MADSEPSTEPSTESTPAPAPVLTTDEKLDKIVEILKSIYTEYEYDDDKYRWTYDMLKIREALNEL